MRKPLGTPDTTFRWDIEAATNARVSLLDVQRVIVIALGTDVLFPISLIADMFMEANHVIDGMDISCEVMTKLPDARAKLGVNPSAVILVSDDICVPNVHIHSGHDLRRMFRAAENVCAVGGAVGVLAQLGLLSGRRATAPRGLVAPLSESYKDVQFEPGATRNDGRYWTCAGGVATADLVLCLIERLQSRAVKSATATRLLLWDPKKLNDTRRLSVSARYGFRSPALSKAIAYMHECMEEAIGSAEVAGAAGISRRQMERLFMKYLHTTPRNFLVKLRLERARELLAHSDLSVGEIGQAVGLGSNSHIAKCFQKHFGTAPLRIRRLAGHRLGAVSS